MSQFFLDNLDQRLADLMLERWHQCSYESKLDVGATLLDRGIALAQRAPNVGYRFLAVLYESMLQGGFSGHELYRSTLDNLERAGFSHEKLCSIYKDLNTQRTNEATTTIECSPIPRNEKAEINVDELFLGSLLTPSDNWFLAPLCPGVWRNASLNDDKNLRAVATLNEVQIFDTILGCRIIKPSFYKEIVFVEVLGELDNKRFIVSVIVTEKECFAWDGSSPHLHRVNATYKLVLNDSTVISYIQFFCMAVQGEQGPFRIVQSTNDILNFEKLSEESRITIKGLLKPMTIKTKDERGRWPIDAIICYSGNIFEASFVVHLNGMVEMLDDAPLVSGLTLVSEGIKGGLRFLHI
jgi:hypothetical protein